VAVTVPVTLGVTLCVTVGVLVCVILCVTVEVMVLVFVAVTVCVIVVVTVEVGVIVCVTVLVTVAVGALATRILALYPNEPASAVSVTEITCMPFVLSVTLNALVPPSPGAKTVSGGSIPSGSVTPKVTVPE
jgi:hypothetical protein